MLTVVSRSSGIPWLRTTATALRNTSGRTTADPAVQVHPVTQASDTVVKYRKSRRLASPIADPDASGCM